MLALPLFATAASPQGDSLLYTDFRPQYTQWQDNYILDKIEYWSNRTVFFFRYKAEWEGGDVTYYGPNGASPWYLKNLDPKPGIPRSFKMTEVRNIRVGGVMRCQTLRSQPLFKVKQVLNEVHTAEIVFPRLPVGLTQVDLIEGPGNESSELHFNALKVSVKPPGDPALGSEKDMDRRIRTFETGTPPPTVPEPEINPKPEPELEVKIPDVPPPPRKETNSDVVISIYFVDNTTTLGNPDLAEQYLNHVYRFLRDHPAWSIRITGHADGFLDDGKATPLSEQRAQAVNRYFLKRGIRENRIKVVALGSAAMVSPKGSGKNRRVDISFFK